MPIGLGITGGVRLAHRSSDRQRGAYPTLAEQSRQSAS
jgi:hypothetical protein